MPWFPGAVRKEIPRFRTPMTPVRVNLHTAVSSTTSLYSYFAPDGRVCSHFYVREDGTVEQYVNTAYRAAADLKGNPDTVSIETWDGYLRHWRDGDPVPAWTPAQVASLTRLVAWILTAHPSIPARLASDSRPGPSSHGVSWHRLGCDPWRHPSGLRYSDARGKVCPGDARIAQIPGIFAATAARPAAPAAPTTSASEEDDDMPKAIKFTSKGANGRDHVYFAFPNAREYDYAESSAEIGDYTNVLTRQGFAVEDWKNAAGNSFVGNPDVFGRYVGPASFKPVGAKRES